MTLEILPSLFTLVMALCSTLLFIRCFLLALGVGIGGNSVMHGPNTNNAAKSITCITGNHNLPSTVMSAHSTGPLNIQASPATYGGIVPYHKSSIPGLYSYQGQQGRVTVFSGGGFQGVGAGSPTKSMSSGLLLITL